MEDYVDLFHYAILELHARNDDNPWQNNDVLSIFNMAAEFKGSMETVHTQVMAGLWRLRGSGVA